MPYSMPRSTPPGSSRPLVGVRILFAFFICLGVFLPGCSFGYTNLHPDENSALYDDVFSDLLLPGDEPRWLWIRGVISGDFRGDGTVAEEAVIATIQKGDRNRPGPIESAFLAICDVDEKGGRKTIARVRLFEGDPIAGAPKPENDLWHALPVPLTRTRAQVVQDKVGMKETVVVYFWGESLPGGVWYVGYSLDNDRGLVKKLETALWQKTPGFLTVNLDRSIEAAPFGYQLILGATAIPAEILAKLDNPGEAPTWGHVFARGVDGVYHQADRRFGDNYRRLENRWNQIYLTAVFQGLPPDELAWFEYYLGVINTYTGNADMAARFLEKARKNAKDPTLARAVAVALRDAAGQGEK